MKKSELEKIYRKVAKEIGFKKDPVREGWMPKLGPNDYKCKIVHGFTEKGAVTLPVTLTVGPKGTIDMDALKIAADYVSARKLNNPNIALPRVLDFANCNDMSWVVRERIPGKNPLDIFPFAADWQKRKIAQLYWNTVAVFSAMESENQQAGNFEYFIRNRLDKWVIVGKVCKSKENRKKHEVFENIANNFFRFVFYETDLCESADIEMQLFFKNFGSTDLVCSTNIFFPYNNYYLPSSEIVFLPEFYGAAYFVWNVLMYSYERLSVTGTIEDMKIWQEIFKENCPVWELKNKFDLVFCILLFERVVATLLVDIPLRRSPFDVKGQEGARRAQKSEKFFVAALKYLMVTIPTLVENPFKEDIALLGKIYK